MATARPSGPTRASERAPGEREPPGKREPGERGPGKRGISATVLIVVEPFPGLDEERVAAALARGLEGTERRLIAERASPPVSAERLRAGRAVVIATAQLDERTLANSWASDTATTARQSGVPAYAVTAANALGRFDARMLDLQAVIEARSPRALRSAGAKLARAI